jgi:hypothetical protein
VSEAGRDGSRDERTGRNEARVALGKRRSLPHIAKQHFIGELGKFGGMTPINRCAGVDGDAPLPMDGQAHPSSKADCDDAEKTCG